MKPIKYMMLVSAGIGGLLTMQAYAAQVVDVVQAPTGFFVPDDSLRSLSPYYRWWDEDWGWTHSAIEDSFTTATLSISAYDVDFGSGEMDVISIINGTPVVLGTLTGVNNAWSYGVFDVTPYATEIAGGLKVWINIDSTHNYDNWAVTLAKSVLTLDGASPPPPNPGVPDTGSTLALFGLGLSMLGALRKWIRI